MRETLKKGRNKEKQQKSLTSILSHITFENKTGFK